MNDSVKTSVCVSLAAYVERQTKRFSNNLERVLSSGDVDGVHDVRVASRRLHEPLRLISGWLGDKPIRKPAQLLRSTRQSLSRVRDVDVLLDSLCGSEPGSTGTLEANDLARLEGALTRRRDKFIRKAVATMSKQKAGRASGLIWRLSDKMLDVVGDDNDLILAHQVEDLFERALEQLVRRDPRGDARHDLHETRICVKRVRYAGELMRDVGLRQESALLKSLVCMQDLLGHWNDRLTAIGYLTREARRPTVLAEDAGWSARVLSCAAEMAKEADTARGRIYSAWEEFDRNIRACHERQREGRDAGRLQISVQVG